MQAYKHKLKPLPPGVYELIVHTGYDDDEMRGATANHSDWGAAWRQRDLDLLKSTDFRQFLRDEGFILINWKDIAKTLPAEYAHRGIAVH